MRGERDNGLKVGGRIELEAESTGDQVDQHYLVLAGGFGEFRSITYFSGEEEGLTSNPGDDEQTFVAIAASYTLGPGLRMSLTGIRSLTRWHYRGLAHQRSPEFIRPTGVLEQIGWGDAHDWQMLLFAMAGWINRYQLAKLEFCLGTTAVL